MLLDKLSQTFAIEQFYIQINSAEGEITSAMLADLFNSTLPRRNIEGNLFLRYQGQGLPIQSRKTNSIDAINNKLENDYRGDIIDTGTSYILGNPIKYTVKPERYESGKDSEKFKKDTDFFDEFLALNSFDDTDFETGIFQGVCGHGARLCFVGTEKTKLGYPQYRVINIDPTECVFIYNPSTGELEYSARFYTVYETDEYGNLQKKYQAEFYDKQYVYYYLSDLSFKKFVKNKEPQLHLFDYVPLFEVVNNVNKQGDFEKIETLIDAYDRALSDNQNEIEAFRQAYLVAYGVVVDAKTLKTAKQCGLFSMEKEDKIEYLTKQINKEFTDSHLDRLTKNIYRFAKSVDTTSDTFTGSGASGEARKWALLALENKGSIKIAKFKKALTYQFKVLASAWNKIGISINESNLGITFDRNLPVELLQESQIAANFKGIISDRTLFENLSIIKNADDEIVRIKDEQVPINLDEVDEEENG
jgi:SPP1 family phage portal protein